MRPGTTSFLLALLLTGLVVGLTLDERRFGLGSEARRRISTAVALANLREMGISRGELSDFVRPQGDVVFVGGIGSPLIETLPVLAAENFERTFGPGSSQFLFVAQRLVFVLLAALAAGLLSFSWGGDAWACRLRRPRHGHFVPLVGHRRGRRHGAVAEGAGLLAPMVPLVAALAGYASSTVPKRVFAPLLAAGFLINGVGALAPALFDRTEAGPVRLASPLRWPNLGMSLGRSSDDDDGAHAYLDALRDQLDRAVAMNRPERAVLFGERLYELWPTPRNAVRRAEAHRIAKRRDLLTITYIEPASPGSDGSRIWHRPRPLCSGRRRRTRRPRGVEQCPGGGSRAPGIRAARQFADLSLAAVLEGPHVREDHGCQATVLNEVSSAA